MQERLKSPSVYNMTRISSLLRQMFLDGGNSLAPPIAKKYGIRLEFLIISSTITGKCGDGIEFIYDGLFPFPGLNVSVSSVNLEQFLRTNCMATAQRAITVREIILMVSNVKGGVHFGQPKAKNPEQVELMTLDEIIHLGGLPITMQCLFNLSRVILTTLEPIAKATITK